MENILARSNMVKGQLQTCGIDSQNITDIITQVKREDFVPDEYRDTAYVDGDIPLGRGRYIVSPFVFSSLLTEAKLFPSDKVLIIAGNLGYSAAVISQLASHVTTVEQRPDLVNKARQNLKNFDNVEVVTAPLTAGYPNHQPYDVIIIEAIIEHIPDDILSQLAEGGSVVTIKKHLSRAGSDNGAGTILHLGRQGSKYLEVDGDEINAPILSEFNKKPVFKL